MCVATGLLLALSAFRWVTAASPSQIASTPPDGAHAHARATREAADEGERRARPLEAAELVDPNRAPEAELDRLPGVGPATARAIVAARDSGLTFRRPADLEFVRGIGPALVERMAGHLDLTGAPLPNATSARRLAPSSPVDINRADEDRLAELPGVGPVIARRIISARRERPFTSLDDLTRVQGIGPATVVRLAASATVGAGRR